MATTTSLLVTKIEASQASKEVTANEAFDDFDSAIAGRLSLSVAGGANVTLTDAQALNAILEFTGILTGSINVIVPTRTKLWAVYNDTTGAYTLTVKTSGGTGIAVTQSSRALLYCDGINVVQLIASAGSYQPLDATLTALAGLATGADKLAYSTGTDTFAQTDLTSFARTLLDDADAATARATLGVDAAGSGGAVSSVQGRTGAVVLVTADDTDDSTLEVSGGKLRAKDAGITSAKLANMAQATVKGRASGAGTGAPGDLSASQLATIVDAVAHTFAELVSFDKAKRSKVVTLTDAATVAVDASAGDAFFLSTANSRAFGIPSNAPAAGYTQIITITVYNSSGGAITPTLTTSGAGCYRYGTTVTAFPTIAASKSASVTLKWHQADSKWDVLGKAEDF